MVVWVNNCVFLILLLYSVQGFQDDGQHYVEPDFEESNNGCPQFGNILLPLENDCASFIDCNSGRGTLRVCGDKKLFNPKTRTCEPAKKVRCKNDNKKKSDLSSYYPEKAAPVQSYGLTENQNKYPGETPTDAKCAPGSTGHFPHPQDCRRFLHCWDGRTFEKECGPGTAFNTIISVCDHIYNVPSCNQITTAYEPQPDDNPESYIQLKLGKRNEKENDTNTEAKKKRGSEESEESSEDNRKKVVPSKKKWNMKDNSEEEENSEESRYDPKRNLYQPSRPNDKDSEEKSNDSDPLTNLYEEEKGAYGADHHKGHHKKTPPRQDSEKKIKDHNNKEHTNIPPSKQQPENQTLPFRPKIKFDQFGNPIAVQVMPGPENSFNPQEPLLSYVPLYYPSWFTPQPSPNPLGYPQPSSPNHAKYPANSSPDLSGHPQPSSSNLFGYPQSNPTGYPQPLPSKPSGYPQPYPSNPSGYPQPNPSNPSGYPQPNPANPSGYPQPNPANPSGYPQPNPANPSGFPQPIPSNPSGYPQPGSLNPAGYPQPIPSNPSGYPQPNPSNPSGYPQPGSSNPSGYPQPFPSSPSGYPQPIPSDPSGYPQPIPSNSSGYPQPNPSNPSGYPQPMPSNPSGYLQPIPSNPSGNPQPNSSNPSGFKRPNSPNPSGFPKGSFPNQSKYPQPNYPDPSGNPQNNSPNLLGYPQPDFSNFSGYPQPDSPNLPGYPKPDSANLLGYPQQGTPNASGYPQQPIYPGQSLHQLPEPNSSLDPQHYLPQPTHPGSPHYPQSKNPQKPNSHPTAPQYPQQPIPLYNQQLKPQNPSIPNPQKKEPQYLPLYPQQTTGQQPPQHPWITNPPQPTSQQKNEKQPPNNKPAGFLHDPNHPVHNPDHPDHQNYPKNPPSPFDPTSKYPPKNTLPQGNSGLQGNQWPDPWKPAPASNNSNFPYPYYTPTTTETALPSNEPEGQFYEEDPPLIDVRIGNSKQDTKFAPAQKKGPAPNAYEPTLRRMLPIADIANPVNNAIVNSSEPLPPVEIPAPPSGQNVRLRRGSSSLDGYVEIRDRSGKWGLACDRFNEWNLLEASIICKELGYSRGAELSWQGYSLSKSEEKPYVSVDQIVCHTDGDFNSSCQIIYSENNLCQIDRHAAGVRCYNNVASSCQPGEVHLSNHCYSLHKPNDSGTNMFEAAADCLRIGGHLLDVNTQLENDFVSEWVLRSDPNITSVMTSGVGFMNLGIPMWLWQGTDAPMLFQKWWMGWSGQRSVPQGTMHHPVCLVMRRKFPCLDKDAEMKEDLDEAIAMTRPGAPDCITDYFFWDVEPCSKLKTLRLPYVCERPISDIGCLDGNGVSYDGVANTTSTGKPCLFWNHPKVTASLSKREGRQLRPQALSGHNFCRSISPTDPRPWCFVEGPENSEYCDIPRCDSAKLLSSNP